MSLDGFIAGLDDGPENPLGNGAEWTHQKLSQKGSFLRQLPAIPNIFCSKASAVSQNMSQNLCLNNLQSQWVLIQMIYANPRTKEKIP
jgi:hypothetical protein